VGSLSNRFLVCWLECREDTVTVQELAEAIRKTRKTSDEQKIQRICEVLDDDQDGAVKVDDLLKVILICIAYLIDFPVCNC
jgi:Ca2+-binding EF-hand superfamily protein